MQKQAYKENFDRAFKESFDKITAISARRKDGTKRHIDLDPSSGWVDDESKKAAHLTIEFPDGVIPTGNIVIGYMGKDYKGEPISVPVDRHIHVIKGRIIETQNGQTVTQGEKPLIIEKGELAQVDALEDSVIVIDLTPNSDNQFYKCAACDYKSCLVKDCSNRSD